MKDEIMTYEGVCRYCGQIIPVLAKHKRRQIDWQAKNVIVQVQTPKRKKRRSKKCRTNRRK